MSTSVKRPLTNGEIEHIVVRSRPFHLDVRFAANKPRLRIMTAVLQGVVNEFSLRLQQLGMYTRHKIRFEAGPMPVFDFGFESISRIFHYTHKQAHQVSFSRKKASTTNPFMRLEKGPSEFATSMQDDAARNKLLQQDKDLDDLGDVVHDLMEIADTVNKTVDQDMETLDHIAQKTEHTHSRINDTNVRITKLL